MEHFNFILYGVNDSNLEIFMYIEDGRRHKISRILDITRQD